MILRRLAIAMLASAPLAAGAENLLQVYQDARGYDAQLAAARQAALAGQERIAQGRALLLPSLNLTANAARSNLESDSKNATVQPSYERTVDTYGYSLTFTQPIYRRQNWLQADQGELQARQAELQYNQAHQDLILRAAQAYFDVLAAQDTLALVRAQKAAIQEQLAQAKRNFEVGTATITDTHEAQARYDLSASQEISAENEVEARARQLQLITGKEYPQLKPLRSDVKVSGPEPKDMQSWVSLAEKQNYAVLIQEHTLSDDKVTVFTKCTFKGAGKAQVGFPSGGELRQMYDFVDCTFEGNAFWVAEGVPASSQIRVIRGNLGTFSVHPPGGPGQAKPAWNATTTPT